MGMIGRTFLRASTTFVGPDPRAPPNPLYFPYESAASASEASTGVGDLLLRLKYVISRAALADVAAGLTLSLPTGDRSNFQGTGDTLVGAAIYASRTWAERVEPHVNLSFVLDADKFDRSQLRYSFGADLRVLDWLTLNNDFLGRSDVAQAGSIDQPVFVQIERADAFQFSTGLKVAPPWRRTLSSVPLLRDLRERGSGLPWVWFFNVLLPLNEDGVRSNHVFTFGAEVLF